MSKKTTTARGLGWRHQQAVEELKRLHKDGSPCDWCGKPRWLDPTKNWDYTPGLPKRGNGVLQGDHSGMSRSEAIRRGLPVLPPDRLLHAECNRARGAGINDDILSPVNRQAFDNLSMPWPW